MKEKAESVEKYIEGFPEDVRSILEKLRLEIKKAAPTATESIAYGMPAYKQNGKPLVYYAGYKNHIGFYATPTGHAAFEKKLSAYKQGKGSVQFPLNSPIPFDLIAEIVKFRVQENLARGKTNRTKT